MVNRVEEAIGDYDHHFEKLMAILHEQGERAGDIVRYLTFRLDFNEYYGELLVQKQKQSHGGTSVSSNSMSFSVFSDIPNRATPTTSSGLDMSNMSMGSIYKGMDETFNTNVSSITASTRNTTFPQQRPSVTGAFSTKASVATKASAAERSSSAQK
jgi:hypothetical protein